jgi:hypothetical protein
LDDGAGGVVVVVAFFDVVVVVVDDVDAIDARSEWLEPFWSDFELESTDGWVVVVVDGGAGAVLVVDDDAAASTKVPAVAPGRGSVLAGGAEAGDDVEPPEGLAGSASVGEDGGGTAVSGAGVAGSATLSAAAGRERAAWRARRTSGRDSGDTPAVAKRDETSSTPKSPRSTPVAVPRAHVRTRTRRTGRWCDSAPHEGVKTMLNRRQDRKSPELCGVSEGNRPLHRPPAGRIGGR